MMNKTELFIMRRNKKITLKELAEHLQCSISLVSQYERGTRNLNFGKDEKYKQYIIDK